MSKALRIIVLVLVLLGPASASEDVSSYAPNHPSGIWNLDTLYFYLSMRIDDLDRQTDQRFKSQEQVVRQAFEASKEAINKANTATEKRFDSVNEFRKTLSDQTSTFMPRTESMSRHDAARERMDLLAARIDKMEGMKSGVDMSWVYLIGAISAISALVTIYAVVSTADHHKETHGGSHL